MVTSIEIDKVVEVVLGYGRRCDVIAKERKKIEIARGQGSLKRKSDLQELGNIKEAWLGPTVGGPNTGLRGWSSGNVVFVL